MQILIPIIEALIFIVPALLIVAFTTVAERKTMASMQRRLGPNYVGLYGLLQAFADALKLLLKEYVLPTQANLILFFMDYNNSYFFIIRLCCSTIWTWYFYWRFWLRNIVYVSCIISINIWYIVSRLIC